MIAWDDPIGFLHGLSPQQRRALRSFEVRTVGELLSLFPRRYDDYTRFTPLTQAPSGLPVTVKVRVDEIKQAPTFRKYFVLVRAKVSDPSGSMNVTWFNQGWLVKQIQPGDEVFLSGTITVHPRFGRGFSNPLWEPATSETLAAGTLAPVYPLTGSVAQKTLRKIMKVALENEIAWPVEWLPVSWLERLELPSLEIAYRSIHRPESSESAERARQRFAFSELLLYQLALRLARYEANTAGAPVVAFDEVFAKRLVASLPFELTVDQKRAAWSIVKDLASGRPMRRLLQGDVGSGKTVVAAFVAAMVFHDGASAALMAPTDLLAKQHAETLKRFLLPQGIPVLLLTSSTRCVFEGGEEQKLTPETARERLKQGRTVVVGTHALLERDQSPRDLALAIVDEQHRFGVAQREALVVSSREDGKVPHLLSMSATPIPRSLALTLFGDLDVSVIRAKPVGRQPIVTSVGVGEGGRDAAYRRIREQVMQGHRAFIVCALIDSSDVLGVKSVEAEVRRLQAGPLQGLRVGALHGKMPAKEKDAEMQKFIAGDLDVLVATTVVEVGVDVPQATVMMVESAERFGLAQLHQLRGRVGRSAHQSYCILIASDEGASLERLRVLERTTDGFVVAEEDLRLRGEGNLMGTQQSGEAIFRVARMDDLVFMAAAREASAELTASDPELRNHPALRVEVLRVRESSHRE